MGPVRHRWSINDVIGGIRNTVMPSDCSPSSFMSIPFVPLEDVQAVFDSLVDNIDPDVMDLALYMERTYIRGTSAGG
ncbi:hypothetical protein ANN_05167 [Periplaneta americana]|uniref:Uncharacterized protein n=1 Tax=Periplaneta americana TaxID=6978 RepID=A0ABQ8TCC2_PERAM|nr:hypothetical protein ANN_05167 [Periplaneta americana]